MVDDPVLTENYRCIAAALEGMHATMFGLQSIGDKDLALQAISDGGVLHEQLHLVLRILLPQETKDDPEI